MLLVAASAGPIAIHGFGLIARQSIAAGTVIWELRESFDRLITEDELAALSEPSRQQVLYYAYFCKLMAVYVLSSDDDRFTNHSDRPNTIDAGDRVIATRSIAAGEEITANYADVGVPGWVYPSARNSLVRSARHWQG